MTTKTAGTRPALAVLGTSEGAGDWTRALRAENTDVRRIPFPDDDLAEILGAETDAVVFVDVRDPAPVKRAIVARKHALLAGACTLGSRDLLLLDDLARARDRAFLVDVAGLADPALDHIRRLARPDHPLRRPRLIRCTIEDPSRDLDALLLDAIARVIAIAGALPDRVSAVATDDSTGGASAPPGATSGDSTSSRARNRQLRHPERSEGSGRDTGAPVIHRGTPSAASTSGASDPPGAPARDAAAFATPCFTTLTLAFENGLTARIDVASGAVLPHDTLTVVSAARTYTIDALEPVTPVRILTALRGADGLRVREHLPYFADLVEARPSRIARFFCDAIAEHASHDNARDAARALLVREIAQESARAAGDFVRLPANHPLVTRPRPTLHVIRGGGHTTDAVARPRLRLVQGGRPARDFPLDDPPRSA
jgi:hypothetical protein